MTPSAMVHRPRSSARGGLSAPRRSSPAATTQSCSCTRPTGGPSTTSTTQNCRRRTSNGSSTTTPRSSWVYRTEVTVPEDGTTLIVNGESITVASGTDDPLLYVLRDDL